MTNIRIDSTFRRWRQLGTPRALEPPGTYAKFASVVAEIRWKRLEREKKKA